MDVANGDICQFITHNCSTIVNAANMEVRFGAGISNIIGNATGQRANINNEAKNHIDEFNRRINAYREANNRLNLAITAAQNVAGNAVATQEEIRTAIEGLRVFAEAAEGTNECRA